MVGIGKFLSLLLRHKPESIGLSLDANGWADVDELIHLVNKSGRTLTFDLLSEVVANNDKQRFIFNDDKTRIRANQGHSIEIELGLPPIPPPDRLYHGTASRFLESIAQKDLVRGKRQHVHLSKDTETAIKVGKRHGKPAVLKISAARMHRDGFDFFLAKNGVWLTRKVPVAFIAFPFYCLLDREAHPKI